MQAGLAVFQSPEDWRKAFIEFRRLLDLRKFPTATELVGIYAVSKQQIYAPRISGIYYRLWNLVEGRVCYQKLLHAPNLAQGVCTMQYISWNSARNLWQITIKSENGQTLIAYGDEEFHTEKNMCIITQEVFGITPEVSRGMPMKECHTESTYGGTHLKHPFKFTTLQNISHSCSSVPDVMY